jgi:MFS family permease
MTRNIYLAYFLAAMKHSWFFLGIWVLYYLRFTNYAGIGLLESVMIITTTAGEIPTGAIADLLGKKKTLILSFFIEAIGGYGMVLAQNFNQIAFSVFVMCIGGAMYSGTLDALVYDSLKQENKETGYDKIIANISTVTLATIAIVSILGGWLYSFNPRFPFFATATAYVLGFVASFFLIEPIVDTAKFSFKNYLHQTKQGFNQLFSLTSRNITIRLLILGGVFVVLDEMFEAFLLVEFGFRAQAMGIIYAIIYILSAFSSQLGPWLTQKLKLNSVFLFLGLITAISLIISPFVGMIIGGLVILLRYNFAPIFNNLASVMINQHTESKYRATTISTFNMLKNLPYVISAVFIGRLMDIMSARVFAFYFGLALLIVIIAQQLLLSKKTT